MRRWGRAVWRCKLYLLLQWHGLYRHLKALEEIINNGWAADRDFEEDSGHTGRTLKDRFTALILTHHMHLLKQEEEKNGSWARARLYVKTLNTPQHPENNKTVPQYAMLTLLFRRYYICTGMFPKQHTRCTSRAYEFDLVDLREWHLADLFLLSWRPLLQSGRRKYSCPVFPLQNTETSQCSHPHNFFCSRSCVFKYLCQASAGISCLFWAEHKGENISSFISMLLSFLKPFIWSQCYCWNLHVYCKKNPPNVSLFNFFSFWSAGASDIYESWQPSFDPNMMKPTVCPTGWIPNIRDMCPLCKTEVIVFHLINPFWLALVVNMWNQ